MDKKTRRLTRKKRGVSTIVGTLFFLVLALGTFTAISTATQIQSDMAQSHRDVAAQEIARIKEDFSLSASVDNTNKLSVGIENSGANGVEIVDLWVINKASPYTATRYSTENATPLSLNSDDVFVGPNSFSNILANTADTITLSTGSYTIKTVSMVGTVKTIDLSVPQQILRVKLVTVPPNIASGQNVTIAMYVFNNGTSTIENVAPSTLTLIPSSSTGSTLMSPTSVAQLEPGETHVFLWNYKLIGGVDTAVTFQGTASGTDSITGNTITSNTGDASIVFVPAPERVVGKPQLLGIIPSSFGRSNSGDGLWGLVIYNPTDINISVTRVVFSLIGVSSNPFVNGNACSDRAINGTTTDGQWSCPINNIIQWDGSVDVPAHDWYPFIAKIKPDSGGGGSTDDPAYTVTITAFTSLGQYAKVGLISGSEKDSADGAIVNAYLTLASAANPLADASILSGKKSLASASNDVEYKITLADFSGTAAGIASGTKLVINLPPGFSDVHVTGTSGFTNNGSTEPLINNYDDGTVQIVATTSANIGTTTTGSATLTFTADSPNVRQDTVYTFQALVQGVQAGNGANFPIGAVTEIPVRVVAN